MRARKAFRRGHAVRAVARVRATHSVVGSGFAHWRGARGVGVGSPERVGRVREQRGPERGHCVPGPRAVSASRGGVVRIVGVEGAGREVREGVGGSCEDEIPASACY
jgi:hypothetical protein